MPVLRSCGGAGGLAGCGLNDLPDSVDPVEMFGLHEDGAENGHGVVIFLIFLIDLRFGSESRKKRDGEFGQR